jgi:hypothetical protein
MILKIYVYYLIVSFKFNLKQEENENIERILKKGGKCAKFYFNILQSPIFSAKINVS